MNKQLTGLELIKAIANKSEDEIKAFIREHYAANKPDDERARKYALAKMWGGSAADGPVHVPADTHPLGYQVNPLKLDRKALSGWRESASRGTNFQAKAYSTVESLLPPELDPQVLAKIHEDRIMNILPTESITAPSYEVLVHSSTTGAPGIVAEGGTKPEVVLNVTSQTYTAVKLAVNFAISYETLQDFDAFVGYAHSEITHQMSDAENSQILNGTGTGGNMTGLTVVSGALTHDASGDTATGDTALDSIEIAKNMLRTGSALAEANVAIFHPTTFSALRRIKNSLGDFIMGDPAHVGPRTLFGVPVVLTTAQTAGVCTMLDTTKFGRILLREGLSIHTGYSGTDFVQNISRFVMEERFTLAVERPSAVINVTNLPTTP